MSIVSLLFVLGIMFQTDDPASLPQKGDPLSIDTWMLQPKPKMLRHFLASNRSWSQVCEISY